MNKVYIFFIIISTHCFTVIAETCFIPETNPFLGKYENQISFGFGQGFDTGILIPPPVKPVPFYIATLQYSQPTTFFRIPARRSLNASVTVGLGEKNGWEWQDYSIPIAYITEDIAIFRIEDFYMGAGAGAGLQAQENKRLGAKLVFQFKITFGYNFNDRWGTEMFIQHFSNANTADENNSYAFYGLNFIHNF